MNIPTLHSLGLPKVISKVARETSGIVLVTGAHDSGRRATAAALLNEVNKFRSVQITTLEKSISYQHAPKRAVIQHWELNRDFTSYAEGVKRTMGSTPGVICVDDITDRVTMTAMLHAAEAGNLVLGLRHDPDVQQMVRHVIGLYPDTARRDARLCLASALRWGLAQRLVTGIDGGRHTLMEVMGMNDRIRKSIEGDGPENIWSLREITEETWPEGWQSFDQAAIDAFENGLITHDEAVSHSTLKTYVAARLFDIQRRRKGLS